MRRDEWIDWLLFLALMGAVLAFAAGMATGQLIERRAMARAFPEVARWAR